MSLELKIKKQKTGTCKSFGINEYTGTYNVSTNPTGYGSPNIGLSVTNSHVVSLTITDPNGNDFVISSLAGTDTVTDVLLYEVLNTDLGLGVDEAIPDGVYTVEYVIHDDEVPPMEASTLSSVTKKFLIDCQTRCCLDEKLLEIKVPDCNCEVEDITNLDIAYMLLQAAELAIECGKDQLAADNLAFAQKFCNFKECKTCN